MLRTQLAAVARWEGAIEGLVAEGHEKRSRERHVVQDAARDRICLILAQSVRQFVRLVLVDRGAPHLFPVAEIGRQADETVPLSGWEILEIIAR